MKCEICHIESSFVICFHCFQKMVRRDPLDLATGIDGMKKMIEDPTSWYKPKIYGPYYGCSVEAIANKEDRNCMIALLQLIGSTELEARETDPK